MASAQHPGEPADHRRGAVPRRTARVTQWVRNLRAAGTGELRVGRTRPAFRADEVGDDVKAPILRTYLRKWKFEIGVFFEASARTPPTSNSPPSPAGYPVFRIASV